METIECIYLSSIPIQDSKKFEIPYVLNDRLSIEEIETKIANMKYLSSHTYTYYGLRRANEVSRTKHMWE